MDHAEADRAAAVERYLLGELTESEREAFEEHFFGCPECAEEVRLGVRFQANARALLRQNGGWPAAAAPDSVWRRGWWGTFLPAAAMAGCAVLAAVVGYQNLVVIPQFRQ